MIALISVLATLTIVFANAAAFDESVHRTPNFQIFQYDPKFKQKLGQDGGSICWPSALAHRMTYFKNSQQPAYSKLKLSENMLENVEKFIRLCRTSLTGGTSQKRKVPCIQQFFKDSGYPGFAVHIGKEAEIKSNRRAVTVQDLKEALRKGYGVILHVGWLRLDPEKKSWVEKGSHSVNAYGFDYNKEWADERLILTVSDPGVDYLSRPSKEMSDQIEVIKLVKEAGLIYPQDVQYVLRGQRFGGENKLAALQNVFIFSPEK